jgi:hypothetical protein
MNNTSSKLEEFKSESEFYDNCFDQKFFSSAQRKVLLIVRKYVCVNCNIVLEFKLFI